MRFKQFINEDVPEINSYGLGYIIPTYIMSVAQFHVWHLLCPNGQKHAALKLIYTELQDELDKLAEKFIAQGGKIETISESLIAMYTDDDVIAKIQQIRDLTTTAISKNSDMAGIVDSLIDIQEIIDSNLYKFNLQ